MIGLKRTFLKLSFLSTSDLQKVKKDLNPAVNKNKEREKQKTHYSEMLASNMGAPDPKQPNKNVSEQLENILDLR